MIENGNMVAVVSAEDGIVLDFGPAGGTDELISLTPALFDGLGNPRAPIAFIGAAEGQPGVLHVIRRGASLPVRLHTFVTFRGSLLVVESTAEPETRRTRACSSASRARGLGNTPSWVEGWASSVAKGHVVHAFIGRDGRTSRMRSPSMAAPPARPTSSASPARTWRFLLLRSWQRDIDRRQGGKSPRRTFICRLSAPLGDAVAP